MKRLLLLGLSMLFLAVGAWAQPSPPVAFDGARYQLAAHHPRRSHHHRARRYHHRHRVRRGA
jgi:hypothetical protein